MLPLCPTVWKVSTAVVTMYKLFLPHHTPARSRVFAVVDRGSGEVLEAVATFDTAAKANLITDALNLILQCGLYKYPILDAAVEGLPPAVRAAILQARDLAMNSLSEYTDHRGLLEGTRRKVLAGLHQHPLPPACPSCDLPGRTDASVVGRGRASGRDGCGLCAEWVGTITPRSAAVLHHAAVELHALLQAMLMLNDLRDWPAGLWQQDGRFYRQLVKRFEWLGNGLARGLPPESDSVADQIVLVLCLRYAATVTDIDRLIAQLTPSRFDLDWDGITARWSAGFDERTTAILNMTGPMPADWAAEVFQPLHPARVASSHDRRPPARESS